MFKKVLFFADQPKRPLTKRLVLQALGFQALLLLISLLVIIVFPDRAAAVATFILLSLGICVMLWIEIFESKSGIGAEPKEDPKND